MLPSDWLIAVFFMKTPLSLAGVSDNAAPAADELAILPVCHEAIRILRSEETFLLIDKPAGLLSVPGRNPQNRDSVAVRLQQEFAGAAIVHRLDFDTSGVMVIPLTKLALSFISKAFQQRTVEKYYTAVVAGLLQDDSGEINLPIAADADNRPKYKICHQAGKPSLTHYEVLERDEKTQTTRLLLKPVTGRSHQLRLHLWAIGHPILGCSFYHNEWSASAAERLLLHATELKFPHPINGEAVRGWAPPAF